MADFDWLESMTKGMKPDGDVPWDWVPKALRDIRGMGADWDGDNADKPHPEAIVGMVSFLAMVQAKGFPAPWTVYPMADGSIMAEWSFNEDDMRVAAEVCRRNPTYAETMVAYGKEPDRKYLFEDIAF